MNKRKIMLGMVFMWFMLGVIVNYSYAEEAYTEADMKAVTVRFCGEWTWASTHDGVYYVEPGKKWLLNMDSVSQVFEMVVTVREI